MVAVVERPAIMTGAPQSDYQQSSEPAGLTTEQLRFLAWRAVSRTDSEAAREVGLHVDQPAQWRRIDKVFRRRYAELFLDGVTTAVDLCRRLLGQAAETLGAGLSATRETPDGRQVPDWTARHACARTLLQTHGLIRERRELTGPGGGPVQVVNWQLTSLSDDDLDALERVCSRALASQAQPAGQPASIDGESRVLPAG